MESRKMNGNLYIDPVLDKKQWWCWSADKTTSGSAWFANFILGGVDWYSVDDEDYVRAVRSRTI